MESPVPIDKEIKDELYMAIVDAWEDDYPDADAVVDEILFHAEDVFKVLQKYLAEIRKENKHDITTESTDTSNV